VPFRATYFIFRGQSTCGKKPKKKKKKLNAQKAHLEVHSFVRKNFKTIERREAQVVTSRFVTLDGTTVFRWHHCDARETLSDLQ
jgi:hypothetical protein